MADIFLSYAREDRARAARLVGRLDAEALSVYWDQATPAGAEWPELIERQLVQARCVLVLWTQNSVASRWVRIEAYEAMQRHKLLPVLLDAVRQPLAFREIQAFDLAGWEGDPADDRFTRLVQDLRALMATLPPTAEPHSPPVASELLPATPPPPPAPAPASPPEPLPGADLHRPAQAQQLDARRPRANGRGLRSRLVVAVVGATLVAAAGYGAWRTAQNPPVVAEPTPATGPLPQPLAPPKQFGPYATLQRAEQVGLEFHRKGNNVLVSGGPDGYYVQVTTTEATVESGPTDPPAAASRGSATPAAKPSATKPSPRATSPRCSAIVERMQLGETLSIEDLEYVKKECR